MYKTLRRIVARSLMRARVAAFGNNHSVLLNYRYRSFLRAARKKYRPSGTDTPPSVLEGAKRFRHDGFVILPSMLAEGPRNEIKDKVDALFAGGVDVLPVGKGLLRLVDGAERLPEVVNLLREGIAEIIETYFGSHFKIYNMSFYRTVPDDNVPESSFLWHFDNCPDQEIKLMIYLDDVTDETGAFRFKDLQTSERARSLGFWHRDDYAAAEKIFDDPSTTVVAEGPTGTAILFRQGRVIHKATAPRMAHRDVVTMVIIPSLIPWREHYARTRHLLSTNAGLCKNPWTDEPENIGYRY
ncbi:MAG: hypothetical protein ABIQ06_11305 [Caldimonas sp.]